jgi:hypothetical protein
MPGSSAESRILASLRVALSDLDLNWGLKHPLNRSSEEPEGTDTAMPSHCCRLQNPRKPPVTGTRFSALAAARGPGQ